MRIERLDTYVVGNPPPSFGGRYFVSLTLTNDDGIVGVGEVHTATFHPRTVERMIADVFEQHVEGADPFGIDAACTPNFLVLEGIQTWGGFHAEILRRPILWQDGYVIPPTEPGLGVELDVEVAARHPYGGNELHLTSTETPVVE